MKSKCKELEENISASEEADEHQDNAGNQFGGCKGKKQQNRSDWLIGHLMLNWVKVINYLVNCLFIIPRRTTGNNSRLWSIVKIHSTARRNISGFKSGKRKVSYQGLGPVVSQREYNWSHHKNPHIKRDIDAPTGYLLVGA